MVISLKHIMLFESFNLIKNDLNHVHDSISLYKIAEKIYCVVIPDDHLRAMTFLRCQEFYESSSNEFQGKKFTWDRYVDWYKNEGPNRGHEFTYGSDWSGFNLPSESIESCMSDIDDWNTYDDIMMSIISSIRSEENENFYLIGVETISGNNILDHEMAHGFFYTDKEYKRNVIDLIRSTDINAIKNISTVITDYGYADSVLPDEIQAYMSTGLSERMTKIGIEPHMSRFKDNFLKFKKKNSTIPRKIQLSFK